jgi:hypothetical protein
MGLFVAPASAATRCRRCPPSYVCGGAAPPLIGAALATLTVGHTAAATEAAAAATPPPRRRRHHQPRQAFTAGGPYIRGATPAAAGSAVVKVIAGTARCSAIEAASADNLTAILGRACTPGAADVELVHRAVCDAEGRNSL